MAKVTGIGGVFINQDKDVKKLLDWYKNTLGVKTSEYGINFLTPNVFTLVTFDNKKEATFLNFTVDNLEEMMIELKAKNVEIVYDIKDYDYGKFAQIRDCFGGIVELWEPNKEGYLKLAEGEVNNENT